MYKTENKNLKMYRTFMAYIRVICYVISLIKRNTLKSCQERKYRKRDTI